MKAAIRLQNHGCANHPYWYSYRYLGGSLLLLIVKTSKDASLSMLGIGLLGKEFTYNVR